MKTTSSNLVSTLLSTDLLAGVRGGTQRPVAVNGKAGKAPMSDPAASGTQPATDTMATSAGDIKTSVHAIVQNALAEARSLRESLLAKFGRH